MQVRTTRVDSNNNTSKYLRHDPDSCCDENSSDRKSDVSHAVILYSKSRIRTRYETPAGLESDGNCDTIFVRDAMYHQLYRRVCNDIQNFVIILHENRMVVLVFTVTRFVYVKMVGCRQVCVPVVAHDITLCSLLLWTYNYNCVRYFVDILVRCLLIFYVLLLDSSQDPKRSAAYCVKTGAIRRTGCCMGCRSLTERVRPHVRRY